MQRWPAASLIGPHTSVPSSYCSVSAQTCWVRATGIQMCPRCTSEVRLPSGWRTVWLWSPSIDCFPRRSSPGCSRRVRAASSWATTRGSKALSSWMCIAVSAPNAHACRSPACTQGSCSITSTTHIRSHAQSRAGRVQAVRANNTGHADIEVTCGPAGRWDR